MCELLNSIGKVCCMRAGVSNTRAACGLRRRFLRPAMLFGNFQITNSYVAKCLEKRRRQIIESNLNDTQCGFRPGHSNTDHISLSRKNLKNLGLYELDRQRTTGLYELDRQSQPSRRGCHSLELQDQPFTFCRRFDTASIFSTVFSMQSIRFLLRETEPE